MSSAELANASDGSNEKEFVKEVPKHGQKGVMKFFQKSLKPKKTPGSISKNKSIGKKSPVKDANVSKPGVATIKFLFGGSKMEEEMVMREER